MKASRHLLLTHIFSRDALLQAHARALHRCYSSHSSIHCAGKSVFVGPTTDPVSTEWVEAGGVALFFVYSYLGKVYHIAAHFGGHMTRHNVQKRERQLDGPLPRHSLPIATMDKTLNSILFLVPKGVKDLRAVLFGSVEINDVLVLKWLFVATIIVAHRDGGGDLDDFYELDTVIDLIEMANFASFNVQLMEDACRMLLSALNTMPKYSCPFDSPLLARVCFFAGRPEMQYSQEHWLPFVTKCNDTSFVKHFVELKAAMNDKFCAPQKDVKHYLMSHDIPFSVPDATGGKGAAEETDPGPEAAIAVDGRVFWWCYYSISDSITTHKHLHYKHSVRNGDVAMLRGFGAGAS